MVSQKPDGRWEHVWVLEGMDQKNKRENWMQERRDNRDVKS